MAALVEGTPWLLSRSLWIGRVERALSLVAAVPVALLQLCAIGLMVLGALKPIFFDQIGLWHGPSGTWALGFLSDPQARELLGWSAVPVFIVAGALVRRRAPRRPRAGAVPAAPRARPRSSALSGRAFLHRSLV